MKTKIDFKIIVVDDDPDILQITERLLKREDYCVSTAVSGQDCMQAIELDKPDLLLPDVMLPDISGMEICKIIKADPALKSIYVILLSGMQTESEHISEWLETGADGYLVKPVKNRELLAQVDAAFGVIQAQLALRKSEEELEKSRLLQVSGMEAQKETMLFPSIMIIVIFILTKHIGRQ